MSGFWTNGPVIHALVGGSAVAMLSGIIGVLVVIRGQSFAGHAVGDLDTLGGAAAVLVGANPLAGFVVVGLAAAAAMEAIGVRRAAERDVATGVVLSGALGAAALLLYLDSTVANTSGVAVTILFGSLFTVSTGAVLAAVVLGAIGAVLVAVGHRPLLLASLDQDLAAVRGVPVRVVGLAFLGVLAVAVSLSAMVVGSILSTALLVGPGAAALRVTRRVGVAMVLAALIGVAAVWVGVSAAYASSAWPPQGRGWPVSFFVVSAVLVSYLLTAVVGRTPRGTPVEEGTCSPAR